MEQELDFSFQIEVPLEIDYCSVPLIQGKKIYCASPEYFKKFGIPDNPYSLADHHCLCSDQKSADTFSEWPFMENGKNTIVKVSPQLSSSSSEIVHQWVLAGQGIAIN